METLLQKETLYSHLANHEANDGKVKIDVAVVMEELLSWVLG